MTRASVIVNPDGGTLVLTARDPATASIVARALQQARPPIRRRRRGERIFIDWPAADRLDEVVTLTILWEPAARRWIENRRGVGQRADGIREQVRQVLDAGPAAAAETLRTFPWRDKLDPHQLVNVAALTVDGTYGGCVFDEQGTGKTPTTIATFDVLHHHDVVDLLVVVAPKSMVGEWPVEVDRFSHGLYRSVALTGTRAAKAQQIESGADVLVCNYETVVSMLDNLSLLADRARIMLAVDESFFVKNPNSVRTRAIRAFREHCDVALVLCGTPAPNSPDDLVAQFDLIDFGHTFRGVTVDDDRDVAARQVGQVLNERGTYLRSLKRTALPDLPSRTFTEVPVDLAPDQADAYRAALDDLIIDLTDATDETYSRRIGSFLERRATLLRICADPAAVIPGYTETPSKTVALDRVIQDLIGQDEKIVIWSFYRASLDRIAARYAGHGLVRIDGSITEVAARREAVRSFQDDPNIRIFVGNPAAAGAGLTLHAARYSVYESLSNQAAHFLQSLDRTHRRGQTRDVHYITLLCNGTIEEVEYGRLIDKADRQADLLGDPPEPRPTRPVLLDELIDLHKAAPGDLK